MSSVIVIPARYESTRLPAKALLRETGKFLVQHVYEQALKVRGIDQVIIATDDSRIMAAVASFGGHAASTRNDHPSGTDRIAEVAAALQADIVINLQGDEPLLNPSYLELLNQLMLDDPAAEMATLAVPVRNEETYHNPNAVKVVCDRAGNALYFSRSPIPYVRDALPDFNAEPPKFLHHLGLYAYRRDALLKFAMLSPHPLEESEKLEQLRALGYGWTIRVGIVPTAGHGVDTPADYERFVAEYRRRQVNDPAV
ncbi:3-deoxy-manno-octulosonate cytidylyltransferase [Zavarzinella formosa]|uniref:3-deoxy-manno-octulosonate cytidylyltransferase n=1 Tax=Zavarzinella formosa TaxID=360055 RepID=UPI0002DF327E|nr:3-deoxy-manno-octulosonate cytidylyltransferase [Zavarzinella formosa]